MKFSHFELPPTNLKATCVQAALCWQSYYQY